MGEAGASKDLDLDKFIIRHLKTKDQANERPMSYTVKELKELCSRSIELLKKGEALATMNPPVVVVGDIHGQYYDLLRLFTSFSGKSAKDKGKINGITKNKFVFLGDYVDRGRRSLECICLVLALKLKFPAKYILLRGNHESRIINRVYGFYDELADRFSKEADPLWEAFNDVFSWMPLAGLVGKKILCMHGGLSPALKTLDDIRNIPRPLHDPNSNSLALDLMWSDPATGVDGYQPNATRGVSVYFGEDIVIETCEKLQLDLIVRAHQVMMSGYGFFAGRKMITIFTAPRYQADQNNFGSVLLISKEGRTSVKLLKPPGTGNGSAEGSSSDSLTLASARKEGSASCVQTQKSQSQPEQKSNPSSSKSAEKKKI